MMCRKLLSLLLTVIMLTSLSVTAYAESEGTTVMPTGGVTLTITGPTEGISWYVYHGLDGIEYATSAAGTWYTYLETPTSFPTQVWVNHTDSLQTQVSVKPGDELWMYIDPKYDVTVENGTLTSDKFISSEDRRIDVKAPESGTVTIHIAPTDDLVPEVVPFTFYNKDEAHGVVGGSSGTTESGNYTASTLNNAVVTGGEFSVWMASGYAIEVLKGGYVAETCAPSGAAAASVPEGTTCYVLHVDLGADEFVIAAVKSGEHFQIPIETETGTAVQSETETAAPAETGTSGTFRDVTEGSWYYDAIQQAYSRGIVMGTAADTFSPNAIATRGQTVTMLYRALGSPAAGTSSFNDISNGETASAVAWAASSGVVNGVTDTAFAPDSAITREQLVTILYRLAGSPSADTGVLASYTDGGSVQSYAAAAVAWALQNGLLTGYGDGTIRPAGCATRAEVCTLLMRYGA